MLLDPNILELSNMKRKPYIRTILILLCAWAVSGCSQSNEEVASPQTNSALDSIQILDTQPTDALAVKAARTQLKPGDEALVFGQVGGVVKPFLEGYAGFVIGDTEILFCDEMEDDGHCTTPWDACCENPDFLQESRASVLFIDAQGNAIETGIQGFNGIEGLSTVFVKGTVSQSSTPDNLIIEATGVFMQ